MIVRYAFAAVLWRETGQEFFHENLITIAISKE